MVILTIRLIPLAISPIVTVGPILDSMRLFSFVWYIPICISMYWSSFEMVNWTFLELFPSIIYFTFYCVYCYSSSIIYWMLHKFYNRKGDFVSQACCHYRRFIRCQRLFQYGRMAMDSCAIQKQNDTTNKWSLISIKTTAVKYTAKTCWCKLT